MKLTKVFTKYDRPYTLIQVPTIGEVRAKPLTENCQIDQTSILTVEWADCPLVSIEQGLEGVRFFHYEAKD